MSGPSCASTAASGRSARFLAPGGAEGGSEATMKSMSWYGQDHPNTFRPIRSPSERVEFL